MFPWNKNFEVGVPLIDEQHKMLVELLNVLADHLIQQSDTPILRYVFNELMEYTVYHFLTEESIWHEFFPNDDWETNHKSNHNKFLDKVKALMIDRNIKQSDQIAKEILTFLTQWLAFHILDADTRMTKVVLAVQSGIPLNQAKAQVDQEMSEAIKVVDEIILSISDAFSSYTTPVGNTSRGCVDKDTL